MRKYLVVCIVNMDDSTAYVNVMYSSDNMFTEKEIVKFSSCLQKEHPEYLTVSILNIIPLEE